MIPSFLLTLFLISNVFSQEADIIVEATRIKGPLEQTQGPLLVYTEKDWESSGDTKVSEFLKKVTGINIIKASSQSGQVSIFMRGSGGNQTKILIDNIEFSDPVGTSRSSNIAHLELEQFERIEVLKGPMALYYGSDSAGGVIKLYSKKARGDQSENEVSVNLEGPEKISVGSTHLYKKLSFYLGALKYNDDSIASERLNSTRERDGGEKLSLNSHYQINKKMSVSLRGYYTDYDLDRNSQDDPNYESSELNYSLAMDYSDFILSDKIKSSFLLARNYFQRTTINEVDDASTTRQDDEYVGGTNQLRSTHTYFFSESSFLSGGLDFTHEEGSVRTLSNKIPYKSLSSGGAYIVAHYVKKLTTFEVGYRIDQHEYFDEHHALRGLIEYKWSPYLKVYVSSGKSYKAPGIYQLFDSSYGNKNLKPERSWQYEIGTEFKYKSLTIKDAAFWQYYDETIIWDNRYKNSGESTISGYEIDLKYQINDHISFLGGGMYLNTNLRSLADELPRRAQLSAHSSIQAEYSQYITNLSWRFTGNRRDSEYSTNRSPSFSVWQISQTYKIKDKGKIKIYVNNLFDKDYEEVLGQSSPDQEVGLTFNYKY